jgi:hypothetical protein
MNLNRLLLVAIGMILIVGFEPAARAQESRWGSADEPTVKEIVSKEKMWLEADCSRQPGLKDVIADDYQGTTTGGQRINKADALAADANWPDRDCQLGPVKVKFFGDSLAIAYGSESMMRKGTGGKVAKRCLVWTDAWLRREGKWQIVASQDNRVECQ